MATAQWPTHPVAEGREPGERGLLDASHLALLLDLARALSGALDHQALPAVAAHRVRLLTGAVTTRLGELSGPHSLTLVAESGAAAREIEGARPALPTTSAPEREVVRTEAAVWIGTQASARARFGSDPLLELTVRATAWAFLPLVVDERLSGVLALGFEGPREFDERSRAFLAEVASECANALARGSVFARERARADASEDARADAESRRRKSERVSRDRSHLFERERFARARAEAETAAAMEFAEGMDRSQRLIAALARAGSMPAAVAAIAAHAPAAFGALGFSLVWPTGRGRYDAVVSPPAGPTSVVAEERLVPGSGWADSEIHRTGTGCWLEARDVCRRFPATAEVLASLGGETWVGVPVGGTAHSGVLAFVLAAGDVPAVVRGRLASLAVECASVLAERAARSDPATPPSAAAGPAVRVEHVAEYEEPGPRGPESHVLGVFSCERSARAALRTFCGHRPDVVRAWITSWDLDVPAERTRAEVPMGAP